MSSKKCKQTNTNKRKYIWLGLSAGTVILLIVLPFLPFDSSQRPDGVRMKTPTYMMCENQVHLLVDDTAFSDEAGERVSTQEIFDAMLRLVDQAETFIIVDFFLWNPWRGTMPEVHRNLSSELAAALINKKTARPDLPVLILTDPINRVYGDMYPDFFNDLVNAGVPVVFTDLNRLPDSNPFYAKPARFYGRLLNRIGSVRAWLDKPRFANPFQPEAGKISARQLARLLFFKANHRKVLVADVGTNDVRAIVTSFNPADGSAAHSNMGVLFEGPLTVEAAHSELACLQWSAKDPANVLENEPGLWQRTLQEISGRLPAAADLIPAEPCPATGQWLTEGAIEDAILSLLNEAMPGDQVRIAMFYLSDRDVVDAIKRAARGGATIRMILDANKDAFGRTKNGIPNRIIANELHALAEAEGLPLEIRWADTHGEQFHTKAMTITHPRQKTCRFLCGSANWTRRNIGDLNLEADILISDAPALNETFNTHFDRLWNNQDSLSHTIAFDTYKESGLRYRLRTALYRFQEKTGLCTF
ncbi:MAG: hypothetical protein EOM20_10395 [Spartobacteria bacterium]|nr:hypothetical protein [Spartobacteria bacterium]